MALQCQQAEKSIIQFMTENQRKSDFVERLYHEWKALLDSLEISISIRQRFDHWFQTCYKERESGRYAILFEEFLREEHNLLDDFLLKQEFTTIKKSSASDWVQRAIECVRSEKELMKKHSEARWKAVDQKNIEKFDSDVAKVRNLHKDIENFLDRVKGVLNKMKETDESQDEAESYLCGLKEVIKQKPKETNGRILNKHQLESTITTCKNSIHKLRREVDDYKNALKKTFTDIKHGLDDLVPGLIKEVKRWQNQYKLKYAELAPAPSLKDVAAWCADIGLILYEMNHGTLPKWHDIFNAMWTPSDFTHFQEVMTTVARLRKTLVQRTFIVADQDDFIVKTDKKHLPKMNVRILALDKVDLKGVKIFAYFAREEDISSCWNTSTLSLQKLASVSQEMTQNRLTVCKDKKSRDSFEVTFDKLAFKGQFNRITAEKRPFVHEEKYRVVFFTTIEDGFDIHTLSLPMVVTTGANQGCCALASVMWQCYSTDVFSLPIVNKASLPWSEISEMLQAKMSKLSDHKNLSPENINHLKRRLLGSDKLPDDCEVTLNKFCFEKMTKPDGNEQHPFSFWKWFLANYNLLDKYLKQYWEDDLIGGFLSKDDIEQMFKSQSMPRNGTFVLRFSDNHINDSQGINSVFGYLTAMVTRTKCEENGEKKYKIHTTEVADHKKLKDKNLANILKESLMRNGEIIYQQLFPGNRSREEYFDKYCKEGTVVDGYTGRHDAFIVDLEQDMHALKISTGKHRRSSIDSGMSCMSPSSVGSGKKMRSSKEAHPTIANLLSTSSPVTGSPANYSMMSSPQGSPVQIPYSPAPSMSPAPSSVNRYEAVSPASPQSIQSQLPVMIQNDFDVTDMNGSHIEYRTISTNDLHEITSCEISPGNQQPLYTTNGMMVPSPVMYPSDNLTLQHEIIGQTEMHLSQDVDSYQLTSHDGNLPNCQFSNSLTSFIPEEVITGSNSYDPEYGQLNQLQKCIYDLSKDQPEVFNNVLMSILSKLPTEQVEQIRLSFSSSRPSPGHPINDMDSSSLDIDGNQSSDDFMLSNQDIEQAKQADSGSIDVNIFNHLPDDPVNA